MLVSVGATVEVKYSGVRVGGTGVDSSVGVSKKGGMIVTPAVAVATFGTQSHSPA